MSGGRTNHRQRSHTIVPSVVCGLLREDRVSGYNYQSYSDDFDGQNNSGGGLRKQLEEALGEIRSLREKLDGDSRKKTVTDLLKDKGIDPAVSELIPSDADPTQWVDKYAHLLGVKPEKHSEVVTGTEPEIQVAPDDDPALVAEREALEAMRGAAESGSQATISNDLIEGMNKINTEEELISYFKKNGMA